MTTTTTERPRVVADAEGWYCTGCDHDVDGPRAACPVCTPEAPAPRSAPAPRTRRKRPSPVAHATPGPGSAAAVAALLAASDAAEMNTETRRAAAEIAADDEAAETLAVPTFADPGHEPLETEYTWDGYLPRGPSGVVIAAAMRESGKGLLGWNIASAVTNGTLLPGETGDPTRVAGGLTPKTPADVVGIWDEDDAQEDNAWRARAAGADLGRVFDMSCLPGGVPFELGAAAKDAGHIPDLLAFLRLLRRTCLNGHRSGAGLGVCGACGAPMRDPRLVIVDPLDNFVMSGSIQSKQGAGRLLRRLRFVATKTGTTILLVHHLVESGKIGGSSKIVDIPRRVFRIESDEASGGEYKVLKLAKSNGAGAAPLRYRIVKDGHNSRIEWVDSATVAREEDAWRTHDAAAVRAMQPGGGRWAASWALVRPGCETQIHRLGPWNDRDAAQEACAAATGAGAPLAWQPQPGRPGTWTATRETAGGIAAYSITAANGDPA